MYPIPWFVIVTCLLLCDDDPCAPAYRDECDVHHAGAARVRVHAAGHGCAKREAHVLHRAGSTIVITLLGIFREKSLRDAFVWRLDALRNHAEMDRLKRAVDEVCASVVAPQVSTRATLVGKFARCQRCVCTFVGLDALWCERSVEAGAAVVQRAVVGLDVLARFCVIEKVKSVGDAYWCVMRRERFWCGGPRCACSALRMRCARV